MGEWHPRTRDGSAPETAEAGPFLDPARTMRLTTDAVGEAAREVSVC